MSTGVYSAPADVYANYVMNSYKRDAPKRGLDFDLTFSRFQELIYADCYYCGAPPNAQWTRAWWKLDKMPKHNGIDRVDNTKGYVEGNVVACCFVCNNAKRDMHVDDFLAWAKRIANK